MKNAVIFDMDGLMFDTERATYEKYIEVCDTYGYKMRLDFYKKVLGCPLPTAKALMREEFGEEFPMEEIIAKVQKLLSEDFRKQGVPVKKGLPDILEYLKGAGYKMLVATSSERSRVDEMLRLAKVENYFSDAICGSEVKRGKPHPDIFLEGCKKLGCTPEKVWVLEDSEVGVAAAYDAGIDCICVPDMKEPSPECRKKAYRVVDSLLDAIELIPKA